MRIRLRKAFWGAALTLLATVAVGCSANSDDNNSSSSSSSMTTKQVESHYTKALNYLDKGTPQQAYSELSKVIAKNAGNKKVKVLYKNLGNLLSAKRAVTENKLSKADKKIATIS